LGNTRSSFGFSKKSGLDATGVVDEITAKLISEKLVSQEQWELSVEELLNGQMVLCLPVMSFVLLIKTFAVNTFGKRNIYG
jgi:F0F1-type ATP synthase assembly protein I